LEVGNEVKLRLGLECIPPSSGSISRDPNKLDFNIEEGEKEVIGHCGYFWRTPLEMPYELENAVYC
jgi:hypothetical protein